eukprot:1279542-Pleurochrysis_carterae.AAC.3
MIRAEIKISAGRDGAIVAVLVKGLLPARKGEAIDADERLVVYARCDASFMARNAVYHGPAVAGRAAPDRPLWVKHIVDCRSAN